MSARESISVVVPAFEAAATLRETLASVVAQGHEELDVLVVDDGSTHPAGVIVRDLGDPRITCMRKPNSGVSDTRNVGFRNTQGAFVLFLDADDVLGEGFFDTRLEALRADPEAAGAASTVVCIDAEGRSIDGQPLRSATQLADLTRYAADAITCPSGYLFRRAAIEARDLHFDPRLSSSADRLFLLQLLQHGRLVEAGGGPLHYRIASTSMSHRLTPELVADREAFVSAVREADLVPTEEVGRFFARQYYTLAASNYHLGKSGVAVRYALRSLATNPGTFAKLFRG